MTASPLTRDSTADRPQDAARPDSQAAGKPPRRSKRATGPPPVLARPRYAGALLFSAEMLNIVTLVVVAFVAQVTVIGRLEHDRDQQVAYARLREELANGTAPVGPVDPDGKRVELGDPVALLEIPGLGLEEVVVSGTTSGVLASGVGHRRDTVLPGQAGVSVLMGRRMTYGGPFSAIGTLGPGDILTVTTGQGTSRYRVLDVRRPGDPVPPIPEQGAGRLTLVTSGGNPLAPSDVVRVDADLVGNAQPAAQPALTTGSLPPPEQTMHGDIRALIPLVLWGLALAGGVFAISWLGQRWGRWQAWIVAVPLLTYLGLSVAGTASQLLPNLL